MKAEVTDVFGQGKQIKRRGSKERRIIEIALQVADIYIEAAFCINTENVKSERQSKQVNNVNGSNDAIGARSVIN